MMGFDMIARLGTFAVVVSSVAAVPAFQGPVPPPQLLDSVQDGKLSLSAVQHPSSETIVGGIKHIAAEDIAAAGHRNLSSLSKRGTYTSTVSVGSNWYIPVSIGTPPQNFLLLGDSGSPDISVQSNLMPPAATSNSPLYKPGQSSPAKQVQSYTYGECFGSGYCDNGVVYTDNFQVGQITLTGMPILVETNNTSPSKGVRTGTLGLNHDPNGQVSSPQKVTTWFAALKGYLKSPLWTVNFIRSKNSGTFNFGFIDSSQYTGSTGYTPLIDSSGLWNVKFSGYQYADKTYIIYDFKTIIDTGTGQSNLPRNMVDAYFRGVRGSSFNTGFNTYQFPCSAKLLDFTFGLADGAKATIPSQYMLWGSFDGGKTCVSQLLVGPADGTGQSLWGMTFIQALFVVFDYDGNRVGFANKPLSDA